MRNLNEQMKELLEMTAQTRYDFVQAELQTCFTCVDMGKFELGAGNTEFAKSEVAIAERGIQEITRFAAKIPAEQRVEIENRLVQLKEGLDELKRALQSRPA